MLGRGLMRIAGKRPGRGEQIRGVSCGRWRKRVAALVVIGGEICRGLWVARERSVDRPARALEPAGRRHKNHDIAAERQ
jgi:hypothetical protein